jgi:CDP-glucose 4,6-dehydratase
MRIELSFWRDRRVLLTGHTGFKGAWLAAWLAGLGADITGLALPPARSPSLWQRLGLDGRLRHVPGDVRDRGLVAAVVSRTQPEVIIHLAGQAIVFESLEKPLDTFDTNIGGTLAVLEAARHAPSLRSMVLVTSDKCYADATRPCAEADLLGGDDPYSASKAAAELVAGAYRSCFFPPWRGCGVATARAGNVIGGGDLSPNRLVPDIVRAVASGRPAELRHPDAVRPWQHVLDALSGYLQLAQALFEEPEHHARAWNFGPEAGSEWTVRQVAEALVRGLGGGAVSAPGRAGPPETPILRLVTERARSQLGWRPQLTTAEVVAWTAEGYRAFLAGSDMRWLNRQIEAYGERLSTLPRPREGLAGSQADALLAAG